MMNIGEEKMDSVVVISIEGRVDGLTAPELENRISEIVDRGDANVLLDCAEMTYVSSAGLRIFLTGARRCQQDGGKLSICSLQPDCKSVVETSGFHTVIDCHDTREAALAAAS